MTAILNGCWWWKEYECYLGHEEMLGRRGHCARHPWARFLGGSDLWNGSPKKSVVLEGGAVKRMGLWGMRWYGARTEVWAPGGWRRVCLGKVPGEIRV